MKLVKKIVIGVLFATSLSLISCGSTKKAKASKAEMEAPESVETEAAEGEFTEGEASESSGKKGKKSKKNKKEKAGKKGKKGKKGQEEEPQPGVDSEGKGKNKNYIGWVDSTSRNIEYKNGIIKIKVKPKSGTYNISVLGDGGKYIPVLSTRDEYTGSAFFLKAGKKIYKLNADTNIKTMAKKTDNGVKLLYRITNVADVEIHFETFASLPNGDADMIKITALVTNLGTKKTQFALKTILDTVLGESTAYHFYTSQDEAVQSETMYRDVKDSKWFVSKNSSAKFYVFVSGRDCSPFDCVALANYSTLDIKSWEPDMLSYRAFDTVLSYNNSAIGINWNRIDLAVEDSTLYTYYLGFNVENNKSACDEYMWPVETETTEEKAVENTAEAPVQVIPAVIPETPVLIPEPVVTPVAPAVEPVVTPVVEPVVEPVVPQAEVAPVTEPELPKEVPVVKFDVSKLTKEQLSAEYIQNLLDRIAALEEDDTTINREEILQLNAELDAILEVLKL